MPKNDEEMTCSRCNGSKLIPEALIEDSGESSHRKLQALVALRNPDALVFVNPIRAELRANICCSCGHVDLIVRDPAKLWEEYCSAPRQKRP